MRGSGRLLGLLAAVVAVPALAADAPAGPQCRIVKGRIESRPLTGPECPPPHQLCTAGTFSGDLKGRFVFRSTSLAPTPDTPATQVVHYTGDITLETHHGRIDIKDAGAFNTETGGTGDVGAVSTIVGGTRRYAGATGRIRIAGTFTPEDGGTSTYKGFVCRQ